MFPRVQFLQRGNVGLGKLSDGDLAFVQEVHLDDSWAEASARVVRKRGGKKMLTATVRFRDDKIGNDHTKSGRADKDEGRRGAEIGCVGSVELGHE